MATRVLNGGNREVWQTVPNAPETGNISILTAISVPERNAAELSRVSATVYVNKATPTGIMPDVSRPTFAVDAQTGTIRVDFVATDIDVEYTLDIGYNGWQGIDPNYAGFGQVETPGFAAGGGAVIRTFP